MHSQLPTRVSAAESDGEGRRRVMRWKKAVFVIWFIWVRNERVGSRMIPRLWRGGQLYPQYLGRGPGWSGGEIYCSLVGGSCVAVTF